MEGFLEPKQRRFNIECVGYRPNEAERLIYHLVSKIAFGRVAHSLGKKMRRARRSSLANPRSVHSNLVDTRARCDVESLVV